MKQRLQARSILVSNWPAEGIPELMEGFARSDGVASYVFAGQNTLDQVNDPDDEAAVIGALTRPENKRFRQRRLTQDNRPLASSLTKILNRHIDSSGQLQQHEPTAQTLRDSMAPIYRN